MVRLVEVDSPGGSVATARLSVLGKEVAAVIVHPVSVQQCRGREANMARVTGGCLCGRVRYTLTGEPAFNAVCDCQGTLDGPSTYQPAMEIYCSSVHPWVQLGSERNRFPKMPG